MPERSIEFEGKTYTGVHLETQSTYSGLLKRELFIDEENDVYFALAENSNDLIYFRTSSNKIVESDKENEYSYSEAILLAQNLAKSYVKDLSLYEIQISKVLSPNDGMTYQWNIVYINRVQDFQTTDFVKVVVRCDDNTLERICMGQIGAFDECDEISKEKVNESIESTLKEAFETDSTSITSHAILEQRLLKQSDNSISLLSNVMLKLENKSGKEEYKYVTVSTLVDNND